MRKSQITNHKFQTNPNDQNSNDRNKKSVCNLVLGAWSLFVIWYLVLGISILTGCATVDRQRDAELGLVEEEKLEVSADLKFEDLPVPYGFKLNKQESFIFQNDFTRMGLFKYIGKAKPNKIVEFYREQMPLYNWGLINIVEHNEIILNFEKERESCIITLKPMMARTGLTIFLTPKSGPIKEEKEEE